MPQFLRHFFYFVHALFPLQLHINIGTYGVSSFQEKRGTARLQIASVMHGGDWQLYPGYLCIIEGGN